MSELRTRSGPPQPALRTVLSAVVLLIVAVVAWRARADLAAAGRDVLAARPGWLLVLLLVVLGWMAAWAMVYVGAVRATTRVHAGDVPLLAAAGLAAVATNSVVPSSGLAGLPVVLRAARRRGLSLAETRSGYLLAVAVVDLAFVVVVTAGVVWVLLAGSATGPELAAAGLFAVFTAVRTGVVVLTFRHRSVVLRWADRLAAGWARVRRRPARPVDREGVDELVAGLRRLAARPGRAMVPLAAALTVDTCGVLLLWAAVGAVGGGSALSVALVAYVFSSLGAVLLPVPGGLGGAELGAVAALVAGGVPLAVAAAATVLFRVAELWVPLGLGLIAGWVVSRATHLDVTREGMAS